MGKKKQNLDFSSRKWSKPAKANKKICLHDYKNAIKIGNVDYVCPLCKELLDPFEWFFMNSFEFVDVTPKKGKRL